MKYILILIILGTLFFCIKMIMVTSKAKEKGKQVRKEITNRVDKFKYIFDVHGYFIQEGLPIPKEGLLYLLLCEDKIVLLDNMHDFVIKKEQIHEVKYDVERKVEKELKTSTAKGVAGAAMFGTAGAVIGSQPKQKTISNTCKCDLYIKYSNSQCQDSIIKLTINTIGGNIPYRMKEFEKKAYEILLKDRIPSSGTIEL